MIGFIAKTRERVPVFFMLPNLKKVVVSISSVAVNILMEIGSQNQGAIFWLMLWSVLFSVAVEQQDV